MFSRAPRWLPIAVFAILIVGWVALALQLTGAAAGRPGFPFNLHSRLAADYGADRSGRISSLRISFVSDILQDLGFGADGAGSQLLGALDAPVPTATARNFAGDPPFTATVTPSNTPTDTPQPTATPTATRTPTPIPSHTPKPTNTPKPEATEAPHDSVAPSLSGGSMFPAAGTELPMCNGYEIAISGLRVVDPAASSGIDWVKLKYKILGPGSLGYVYSSDIGPPVSGGWTAGPGSKWDAYYKGDLTIDFDLGYASLLGGKTYARPPRVEETETPAPTATAEPSSTPTPGPYTVEVWSIVRDNAGNESFIFHGDYTLPGSCGG